jgi:hypothetical protein
MKWITRERPKTDGIACPWLIRRFIDSEAEFEFVAPDQVLATAERLGGHAFDAPGAKFTHTTTSAGDEKCTFETLIDAYHLDDDLALVRLARIVHAADVSRDADGDPCGPGLLAIGIGGLDVEGNDHRLLDRGAFVYDALYAWCQRNTRQKSVS